jgi:hypothetical protein
MGLRGKINHYLYVCCGLIHQLSVAYIPLNETVIRTPLEVPQIRRVRTVTQLVNVYNMDVRSGGD